MTTIDTDDLVKKALAGLNTHKIGYDHRDAAAGAPAHAVLALVAEQQATNWHLHSIAHSLQRLADAADRPSPTPEIHAAPRRRFFRRTA